jgi:hypothetical protein
MGSYTGFTFKCSELVKSDFSLPWWEGIKGRGRVDV